MFTGIVEETGKIKSIAKNRVSAVLTISAQTVLEGTKVGDSIAVNGICLTVTSMGSSWFTADVMHETLNRSSLSSLGVSSPVNLERAMQLGGRFGGHIVSGHVDGVGKITSVVKDDNAIWYTISAPSEILRYIVEKGSVTLDGISLTVARVSSRDFAISAIPHTVANTVLRDKKAGDLINIENDIIGKYVEKLSAHDEGRITRSFLLENGF